MPDRHYQSSSRGEMKRRRLAGPSSTAPTSDFCRFTSHNVATYRVLTDSFCAKDGIVWDRPFYIDQVKGWWDSEASTMTLKYRLVRDVFPFLDLPAELRNIIYSQVLIQSEKYKGIEINAGRNSRKKINISEWRDMRRVSHLSALLLVSRQIYREALSYLYQNYFDFDHLPGLKNFLKVVRPGIVHLRHVTINSSQLWHKTTAKVVFNLLRKAENLNALAVFVPGHWSAAAIIEWLDEGKPSRLQQARPFIERMAQKKGNMLAGLGVLQFLSPRDNYFKYYPKDTNARTAEVLKILLERLQSKNFAA